MKATMLTRRDFYLLSGAAFVLSALPGASITPAWAQSNAASAFIQTTANQLLTAMKSAGDATTRKQVLQQIVDRAVDVEGIGRFCLGRFWRIATPAQQQDYLSLFHRSLVNSITTRLGDYQDVTLTVGRSTPLNGDTAVASVINAAGKPPAQVQWVVSNVSGTLKVIDVLAEGTSLRQTQRSDYTSFLDGHGGNVQTLIDALKRQEA
jgi:phospholipid transport system substrate-binding protein